MKKKSKSKSKSKFSTLLVVILLILGVGLIAYPTVSNLWNRLTSAKVIDTYTEAVEDTSKDDLEKLWAEAYAYNESMTSATADSTVTAMEERYDEVLNLNGDGVIGYISIDKIDVNLPIYHDVDDSALEVAAGHLKTSSLPIGGGSTHAILMGHRGLPGARLFTDLDQIAVGNTFKIHILDKVFTYKVDQILTVLPEKLNDIGIVDDEDYCTLVTCTPYGVNTHRLLVRGRLVTVTTETDTHETSEVVRIEKLLIVSIIVILLLLLILIILLIKRHKKRKEMNETNETNESNETIETIETHEMNKEGENN